MLDRWQAPLGVALLVLASALCAVIEVMLVPLYVGSRIVPITVALAILSNVALPTLARRLINTAISAALPVMSWIVVVLVASQSGPGGDVLLPGGGALSYVSYGVMLGGLIAGVVTVVRSELRTTHTGSS